MEAVDYMFKVVVIGPDKAGKTSLCLRFTENKFATAYVQTIGVDFKVHTLKAKGRVCKVSIWDTAGFKRFVPITRSYYKGSHGALAVFDVTNRKSFMKVSWFCEWYKNDVSSTSKMVLIGNHCDLEKPKVISYDEAAELAKTLGVPYLETSAKTGHNVEEAFNLLINSMVDAAIAFNPNPISLKAKLNEDHEGKDSTKLREERDFLKTKLEAIEKLVTILGTEKSLLVDNLVTILKANKSEDIEVDYEGNIIIK